MARLAGGERCVSELAQIEGDELSTISQRLRVLRAENIVVRRRRGKHINYALADGHMTDLLSIVLAHASEPLQSRTDDIQEAFDQSQQTGTTLK
jgi:DNA-binding transcriptional ArsR family regulator